MATYDTSDVLSYKLGTKEFGIDNLVDAIMQSNAALNKEADENLRALAEKTTQAQAVYGITYGIDKGVEVDEYGKAPSTEDIQYSVVAFPLRKYAFAAGFTQEFLNNATAGEVLAINRRAQISYNQRLLLELKKAIFNNTNYTIRDPYTNVTLNVKRFLNADGEPIPNSVYGDTFDGSVHTHYLAKAGSSLTVADIDGLINHVVEHGNTGSVKIFLSNADRAILSNITNSKFQPLGLSMLVYGNEVTTKEARNKPEMDNQLLGYWDAVEVWTKPLGVHNYLLCVDTEATEKPLGYRVPERGAGFRLASSIDAYPLVADNYVASFGFGALNRTAGAVMYIGGTTWVNPVLQ